jgi:hypothetical protein
MPGWQNFLEISSEHFGEHLEMDFLDTANKLSLNGLSCVFTNKTSGKFGRMLASKIDPLFHKVYGRNARASTLNKADIAMVISSHKKGIASCITATYEFSGPVNRQLGIVVQLECTLPSYRQADFLQLSLSMLEDCVREFLLRAEDSDRLHMMIDVILEDPTSIEELVLVVPCIRSSLYKIEQLKSIGLVESARSWGLDEVDCSLFVVFEHPIRMPSEPGSDDPQFPLLMRP